MRWEELLHQNWEYVLTESNLVKRREMQQEETVSK